MNGNKLLILYSAVLTIACAASMASGAFASQGPAPAPEKARFTEIDDHRINIREPDGTATGGGHLSFDQYEQDQVIQLTQSESGGRRWAGMVINDRPDAPLDFDLAQRISAMPEGPERTAALQRVMAEGTFGRQRVWVGKTRDRESAVLLSDAQGRPRIRMRVAPDGASAIDFLDENGGVIRSLTPQG